jgi:hypothetical protein
MTLTIQDLGALGELLGSVAVLATLVYLTLQTRQNTLAISAQLEAAGFGANQSLFMSLATSTELQEAMAEDGTFDMTTNQMRVGFLWTSILTSMQWHVHQGRRGLLPTFHEDGWAIRVRRLFADYRSFEGWWEGVKSRFLPEFVEWVEEQRSKAA